MTEKTMNKIHDELYAPIRKLQKEGISKYNILTYLSMTNDTFLDDDLEIKEGEKYFDEAVYYADWLKSELLFLSTKIPGMNPHYNKRCDLCVRFTAD